jgi:small subunit ribosomal protein S17
MAEEEKNETTEETPEEPQAVEEPEVEAPEAGAPEAEAPEVEAPEEPSAEETPEEPAEEAAEEPAAEAEPAVEPEPAAEPEAEAPPAQPARKPKRKRMPRSQRHKHVKPKRERPAERRPIVRLPKPEHVRGRSQERRGIVVSSAMDKTIVVKVDTVKAHPRYKKVVRRSTKFHAHDEQNAAKVGDLVRIVETRPLSKTKNWRLAEVLEEAK